MEPPIARISPPNSMNSPSENWGPRAQGFVYWFIQMPGSNLIVIIIYSFYQKVSLNNISSDWIGFDGVVLALS